MVKKTACALGAAIALCACGSVTAGLEFKPPAGWTATPSVLGRVQMWINHGNGKSHDQVLMLIRGGNSSTDMLNYPTGAQSLRNVKRSAITVCGNQPAERMTATGVSSNHNETSIEAVSTTIRTAKYLAMYIRPLGERPDAQAEAALRSLCPATTG